MWQFVGDDGKQYANFNGPIEMAMLCIGWENPHLVDLRMCVINKQGEVANVRSTRRNLNELFERYLYLGYSRPKV